MTISSSLNAGVAGLNANASRLATISDNIANASTPGYKRTVTDFQALVTGGPDARYTAGGVRTSTTQLIDRQGAIVGTTNATDLAVAGRGFLPTTDASTLTAAGGRMPLDLVTTGSFRPDADGYLISTDGQVLLGWPAAADGTVPAFPRDTIDALEPVRVDANQFAGRPTTSISYAVNLPATGTQAGAPTAPLDMSIEYFDNLGKSQDLAVSFTPTVPATGASNIWTLTIADGAQGGALIGEYTLEFADARTGGGTLAAVTPGAVGGAYDPVAGTLAIDVASGPVTIDIGALGDPDGMTQLSNAFAPVSIDKDGAPVGNLVSVEMDEGGFLKATYDVGITRTIYQVPVVDVPNPNGLAAGDGARFRVTEDSGGIFLWNAGDGPTGQIEGYAREESATDVAEELTQLIQTQRAYTSNAKVIQTVDEMLQETTNIKR